MLWRTSAKNVGGCFCKSSTAFSIKSSSSLLIRRIASKAPGHCSSNNLFFSTINSLVLLRLSQELGRHIYDGACFLKKLGIHRAKGIASSATYLDIQEAVHQSTKQIFPLKLFRPLHDNIRPFLYSSKSGVLYGRAQHASATFLNAFSNASLQVCNF